MSLTDSATYRSHSYLTINYYHHHPLRRPSSYRHIVGGSSNYHTPAAATDDDEVDDSPHSYSASAQGHGLASHDHRDRDQGWPGRPPRSSNNNNNNNSSSGSSSSGVQPGGRSAFASLHVSGGHDYTVGFIDAQVTQIDTQSTPHVLTTHLINTLYNTTYNTPYQHTI